MPTFIIQPASSPAPVLDQWTGVGVSPWVLNPSNDSEYIECGADVGFAVHFYVDTSLVPADLDTIDSISMQVRYSVTGLVDDTAGFTLDFENGAGSTDYITQQIVRAQSSTNEAMFTKTIQVNTILNQPLVWSDTRIRVRNLKTRNMGSDGGIMRISSIQLEGTYTASGGGGTTDHLFLGDKTVTGMKLGDTNVLKAYLGDIQVFPAS